MLVLSTKYIEGKIKQDYKAYNACNYKNSKVMKLDAYYEDRGGNTTFDVLMEKRDKNKKEQIYKMMRIYLLKGLNSQKKNIERKIQKLVAI